MMFEYVRAGDHLLDLGIGTGLSSQPFHRAGLKISGIDISEEMLARCRAKNISSDLRVQDMRESLPFRNRELNHAIAVGAFHFLKDIESSVREVSRVLKPDGIFGFTTACPDDESTSVSEQPVHGFTIYQHSLRLIESLMANHGFQVLKTTRFTYYSDPSKEIQITNRIFVVRNIPFP